MESHLENCSLTDAHLQNQETSLDTNDIILQHANDDLLMRNIRRLNDSGVTKEIYVRSDGSGGTAARPRLAMVDAPWQFNCLKIRGLPSTGTITEPRAGMMIYDTSDNKFKCYNGTTWKVFTLDP